MKKEFNKTKIVGAFISKENAIDEVKKSISNSYIKVCNYKYLLIGDGGYFSFENGTSISALSTLKEVCDNSDITVFAEFAWGENPLQGVILNKEIIDIDAIHEIVLEEIEFLRSKLYIGISKKLNEYKHNVQVEIGNRSDISDYIVIGDIDDIVQKFMYEKKK